MNCRTIGSSERRALRRTCWGGDVIPEGFICLRVGREDTQDVLNDIAQALSAASTFPVQAGEHK
ncbi:MAG: hypothetical protein NVS2B12_21330 [Ktedonobacteraceae bacterium]